MSSRTLPVAVAGLGLFLAAGTVLAVVERAFVPAAVFGAVAVLHLAVAAGLARYDASARRPTPPAVSKSTPNLSPTRPGGPTPHRGLSDDDRGHRFPAQGDPGAHPGARTRRRRRPRRARRPCRVGRPRPAPRPARGRRTPPVAARRGDP